MKIKMAFRQILVFSLVSLASVSLFLSGAKKQSRENDNMKRGDQKGYMNYARKMAETQWRYIGNRNRMPVYPAIMSLFYREGMSEECSFYFLE